MEGCFQRITDSPFNVFFQLNIIVLGNPAGEGW